MTDIQILKEQVIEFIEARREEWIEIADLIHANPEIQFQEFQAAELLSNALEKYGFGLERGVAALETAFVATYSGDEAAPMVLVAVESTSRFMKLFAAPSMMLAAPPSRVTFPAVAWCVPPESSQSPATV